MNILDEIFTTLRAAGHVGSQREYSKKWLGKRPSYYSSISSRSALASTDVLLTLYHRVRSLVEDEGVPGSEWDEIGLRIWIEIMDRIPENRTDEIKGGMA